MKIFVGCSASNNIPNEYFINCKKALTELLTSNDLVFGACNSGIMALAYKIARDNDRKIIGVCPDAYKEDFQSLKCDEEIITDTISNRTEGLIYNSDALVFLPGGIGSIHELFAAIECKRCHEFDKPIVIYNSMGYYDKLLDFLDKVYSEGFARIIDKDLYHVTDDIKEIIEYIDNYYTNDCSKTKTRKK